MDTHSPANTLIQACTAPHWHHHRGVAEATGCPSWSLAAAPLLPALLGSAGCATEPTRDKCHMFPQEQLQETNREIFPVLHFIQLSCFFHKYLSKSLRKHQCWACSIQLIVHHHFPSNIKEYILCGNKEYKGTATYFSIRKHQYSREEMFFVWLVFLRGFF